MKYMMQALLLLMPLLHSGCMSAMEMDSLKYRLPTAVEEAADRTSPAYSSKAIPLEGANDYFNIDYHNDAPGILGARPIQAGQANGAPQVPREVKEAKIDNRLRIYSGSFAMLVEDIRTAQQQAIDLAAKLGGYLEKTSPEATMIRVPAERFNAAIGQLSEIGTVTDKTIEVQDVTDRFYDIRTRLENARALAERLRELLKKTQDIKQAVTIETKLKELQTEIDTLSGKIKLLANQIAYSRIILKFTATMTYQPPRLKLKLPIDWLDDLGLNRLMNFNGNTLFDK